MPLDVCPASINDGIRDDCGRLHKLVSKEILTLVRLDLHLKTRFGAGICRTDLVEERDFPFIEFVKELSSRCVARASLYHSLCAAMSETLVDGRRDGMKRLVPVRVTTTKDAVADALGCAHSRVLEPLEEKVGVVRRLADQQSDNSRPMQTNLSFIAGCDDSQRLVCRETAGGEIIEMSNVNLVSSSGCSIRQLVRQSFAGPCIAS
jgi:hypothetical protein